MHFNGNALVVLIGVLLSRFSYVCEINFIEFFVQKISDQFIILNKPPCDIKQMNDPKIIVALDFNELTTVKNLIARLSPDLCRLKIGKELFTSCGPDVVKIVQNAGYDVFLDLKFHDIPATTAKACKAAADLGVWMVNVHALGGSKMLEASRNAIENNAHSTKLIAVTLLTSHSEESIKEIGISHALNQQVELMAKMAFDAGLDGVVCSAIEAESLRLKFGANFNLVTPGIRPVGSALNDQVRTVTPLDAIKNGSDYLVIGRPITQADNPIQVLNTINNDIQFSRPKI